MVRSPRPWIVTPHGPLEKLEENLWALSSPVPRVGITRRMTMVRLSDGRIVFIDAVPMDEPTLAEIRRWGTPSILVVTNGYHRLDVHAFREKLGLEALTPAASRPRVSARVRVAGDLSGLPEDSLLRAEPLTGVQTGEAVFISRTSSGATSLIFSDALMNLTRLPLWLRLLRYGRGPAVTSIFRRFVLRDRSALRAHFERLADMPDLRRLVVCHGEIVDKDAPAVLRRVAATL